MKVIIIDNTGKREVQIIGNIIRIEVNGFFQVDLMVPTNEVTIFRRDVSISVE